MKRTILLALSMLVLAALLTGCGLGNFTISFGGKSFDVDDHEELAIDGVEKIEISSVSDEITILSGGEKVMADLTGECTSPSKPVWLEAYVSGSTIHIKVKYPQTISNSNTRLTVTLPAGYAGSMSVNTVSGDIAADGLPNKLQKTTVGTVSGDIRFSAASYESMKANTTSGRIGLTGIAARTEAGTVSGDVELDYIAFVETSVKTVSGDVTARIPQNEGFKVDFNTVSGSFRTSHKGLDVDRAKGGFSATVGDGTELIKVSTTSGDFEIVGK